jgi:hypothetical protein
MDYPSFRLHYFSNHLTGRTRTQTGRFDGASSRRSEPVIANKFVIFWSPVCRFDETARREKIPSAQKVKSCAPKQSGNFALKQTPSSLSQKEKIMQKIGATVHG